MRNDRPSERVGADTRRLVAARGLAEMHIYRPGPLLAVLMLPVPGVLAIAGSAVALAVGRAIPVLLPLLLLSWLGILPLTWTAMASVRTSATGIAVAGPWRAWNELPWALIERAEQRRLRLVLAASDGRRVTFAPLLLRDGARLRRELLVRLPTQVLDTRLRAAARNLLGEPLLLGPEGGLTVALHAHPRPAWRWAALLTVLVGAAAGIGGALALPTPLATMSAGAGLIVLSVGGSALWWLAHVVSMSDAGVRVTRARGGAIHEIGWDAIQLIEHTPRERVVRLRGEQHLTCAGPRLMRPADRELMQAYLQTYCIQRGVPVIERRWLI